MYLRVIPVDLNNIPAAKQAVQSWHALYLGPLSHLNPLSTTRIRVADQQSNSSGIYCATCKKRFHVYLPQAWTNHPCTDVEVIVAVDFIIETAIANAYNSLDFLKRSAPQGSAYRELWKVTTAHVVHILSVRVMNLYVGRELYAHSLLHGDALSGLPLSVKRNITRYGDHAEVHPVPHIVIELTDGSTICAGAQAWQDLVRYTVTNPPALRPIDFTACLVLEQELYVPEEGTSFYHCMGCDDMVRALEFAGHPCKVAVVVTFALTSSSNAVAIAADALTCLRKYSDRIPAVLELWKVLTQHCVDLADLGLIGVIAMEELLTLGDLCLSAISAETRTRIIDHAQQHRHSQSSQ